MPFNTPKLVVKPQKTQKVVINKPKHINIVVDPQEKIIKTNIIFDGSNVDSGYIDGGNF